MNKVCISAFFCLFLLSVAGCRTEPQSFPWDGQWQRTIHVPQGAQGRCVDELLQINGRHWQLRATVHSTFECNQPFLEVVYAGDLQQVQIRRGTDDRELLLQVTDIQLRELVDIAGKERTVLSGTALRSLSSRYIPADKRNFIQQVWRSADGSQMHSTVFAPVLALSIAQHPQPDLIVEYVRADSDDNNGVAADQ